MLPHHASGSVWITVEAIRGESGSATSTMNSALLVSTYLPSAPNTGCQRRNASTSRPTWTTSSPHHQSYHQNPHQPRPYQPALSTGSRILPRSVAPPLDRSTIWTCCCLLYTS